MKRVARVRRGSIRARARQRPPPRSRRTTPDAVRTATLDNGVTVVAIPDRTVPVVATALYIRYGANDDPPEKRGLAHAVARMVSRGTHALSPAGFDDAIARLGAHATTTTSSDATVFVLDVPSPALDVALALQADRMTGAALTDAAWQAERDALAAEADSALAQPLARLYRDVCAAADASSPCAAAPLGDRDGLAALSLDDVREAYRAHYVGGAATLVITGDVSSADAFARAGAAFGTVARGDAPPQAIRAAEIPRDARLESSGPSPYDVLDVAYFAPGDADPRAGAFAILDAALRDRRSEVSRALVDGGFAATLTTRWERGATGGLYHVLIGVAHAHASATVLTAFFAAVARIRDRGLDADLTREARAALVRDADDAGDSLDGIAQHVGYALAVEHLAGPGVETARIANASDADVAAAAHRYLDRPAATGILSATPSATDDLPVLPPDAVTEDFSRRRSPGSIVQAGVAAALATRAGAFRGGSRPPRRSRCRTGCGCSSARPCETRRSSSAGPWRRRRASIRPAAREWDRMMDALLGKRRVGVRRDGAQTRRRNARRAFHVRLHVSRARPRDGFTRAARRAGGRLGGARVRFRRTSNASAPTSSSAFARRIPTRSRTERSNNFRCGATIPGVACRARRRCSRFRSKTCTTSRAEPFVRTLRRSQSRATSIRGTARDDVAATFGGWTAFGPAPNVRRPPFARPRAAERFVSAPRAKRSTFVSRFRRRRAARTMSPRSRSWRRSRPAGAFRRTTRRSGPIAFAGGSTCSRAPTAARLARSRRGVPSRVARAAARAGRCRRVRAGALASRARADRGRTGDGGHRRTGTRGRARPHSARIGHGASLAHRSGSRDRRPARRATLSPSECLDRSRRRTASMTATSPTEHLIRTFDPATGRELATYAPHDRAAVDAALDRAVAAFRSWRERSFAERADALKRVARTLRGDDLASRAPRDARDGQDARRGGSGNREVCDVLRLLCGKRRTPSRPTGSRPRTRPRATSRFVRSARCSPSCPGIFRTGSSSAPQRRRSWRATSWCSSTRPTSAVVRSRSKRSSAPRGCPTAPSSRCSCPAKTWTRSSAIRASPP